MSEETVTETQEEIVEVAEKSKGIKETKDALAMVFALAKVFKAAKENDGKIGAADLPLLVNAFPAIGPALEGVTEIPAELKDLEMGEVKELLIYAGAHLGEQFDSEKTKVRVEKGLAAVIALVEFAKEL